MPAFTPNAAKASALNEIFPKDSYEFIIGQPKAFAREYTDKDGNVKPLVGVGYNLRIAEGDHKDHRTYFQAFVHDDMSLAATKRFLMAALGFKIDSDGEKAFNEKYSDDSVYSFDTDSGAVGDIWREVTGKRVIGDLDIRTTEKGQFQQFKTWRSISA